MQVFNRDSQVFRSLNLTGRQQGLALQDCRLPQATVLSGILLSMVLPPTVSSCLRMAIIPWKEIISEQMQQERPHLQVTTRSVAHSQLHEILFQATVIMGSLLTAPMPTSSLEIILVQVHQA